MVTTSAGMERKEEGSRGTQEEQEYTVDGVSIMRADEAFSEAVSPSTILAGMIQSERHTNNRRV
jgi:hypothetical protein